MDRLTLLAARDSGMIDDVSGAQIRDYRDPDEASWLRCRVLGFLDTSYFDDVWMNA